MSKLTAFGDEFSEFVSGFDNFAKHATDDLTKKLTQLKKEAEDLLKKISDITLAAQTMMKVGYGYSLGVVLLGLVFPPALPGLLVSPQMYLCESCRSSHLKGSCGCCSRGNHFIRSWNERCCTM